VTHIGFQEEYFDFSDGYSAFYRCWHGTREPVLYIHGIQSHGLWFERSARYLASRGFTVLMPDRRGSGRNAVARGDVTSYRRWFADIVELCRHLADTTGHPRVHLVAVSWGGKLAAAFARDHSDLLASMALVAPGIYPAVDLPNREKLAVVAAAMIRPTKTFPIPLNDPKLFTENRDRQQFIHNDPDRLTGVTARFLCQSGLMDRHVRICDRQFSMPVKLFLAERDRIIDNPRTLRLFRSWRATAKQLTFYPHTSHTLEFEPDPSGYFHDLAEWIDYASYKVKPNQKS